MNSDLRTRRDELDHVGIAYRHSMQKTSVLVVHAKLEESNFVDEAICSGAHHLTCLEVGGTASGSPPAGYANVVGRCHGAARLC